MPKSIQNKPMSIDTMINYVAFFPEKTKLCSAMEKKMGYDKKKPWYKNQKQHWLEWLSFNWIDNSAKSTYGRIQCPPMLIWLVEAAGVDKKKVKAAISACYKAKPIAASQCAAIRKEIPWEVLEIALIG